MTEQFEQAKRKYIHSVIVSMRDLGAVIEIDEIEKYIDAGVSDLNSLLEQHKEVTLRGELEKFGTYFNEIRCPYVVTSVIDEYLKNVKK